MYGKTIEMFLVDGTADGVVTAELSNWNGKAIKLPRVAVLGCTREDAQGVGVYFLFCPEGNGMDSVYIGESENVLERLKQHLKEPYFWSAAVAFIGRDLNKALIRFLEDKLTKTARECGRCKVLTEKTYKTTLKEAQIATMEEFIDNIKVLLSALNYRVLAPVPKGTDNTQYLYCKSSSASGKGFVSSGGFTVLEGSRISDHTVISFETRGKAYWKLRNSLVDDGIIVKGLFTRDYEFSAPSAASAVILGRTSNGNIDWKTDQGVCLKDL